MDRKKLLTYLDRHGARLEDWPEDAAGEARQLLARCAESRRSFGVCRRVEAWLEATRPSVDSICTTRVVARALREIRVQPPRATLFDRLSAVFAIPAPRLAFAVLATAVGFAVGLWLGTPGADRTAGPHGLPVIASADDVLF